MGSRSTSGRTIKPWEPSSVHFSENSSLRSQLELSWQVLMLPVRHPYVICGVSNTISQYYHCFRFCIVSNLVKLLCQTLLSDLMSKKFSSKTLNSQFGMLVGKREFGLSIFPFYNHFHQTYPMNFIVNFGYLSAYFYFYFFYFNLSSSQNHYYEGVHAVVFVVDCSDQRRMRCNNPDGCDECARCELHNMLKSEHLAFASFILTFCSFLFIYIQQCSCSHPC